MLSLRLLLLGGEGGVWRRHRYDATAGAVGCVWLGDLVGA